MKISVSMANSVDKYIRHWTETMSDAHWFHTTTPLDYIREEMVEEIAGEFDLSECIHLLAELEGTNQVVGVLKVKVQGDVGAFGRWEPAVSVRHRENGVGEALIEKASVLLRERNVFKARCVMKFPYNQPEKAHWHLMVYKRCGFSRSRPRSVLLQADLSKLKERISATANLKIVDGYDFSLRELADFTQKAFLFTPEDRTVHKDDHYISNQENLLKILEAIKTGKMGFSSPELWRAAMIKDEVAGFIIGFIPQKSKYRPLYGIIGELGVLPEYRRKGIARSLIADVSKAFRKHGCSYSLVGTPKTNNPALNLYVRMGYTLAFEQIDLEKNLQPA